MRKDHFLVYKRQIKNRNILLEIVLVLFILLLILNLIYDINPSLSMFLFLIILILFFGILIYTSKKINITKNKLINFYKLDTSINKIKIFTYINKIDKEEDFDKFISILENVQAIKQIEKLEVQMKVPKAVLAYFGIGKISEDLKKNHHFYIEGTYDDYLKQLANKTDLNNKKRHRSSLESTPAYKAKLNKNSIKK